MYFSKRDEIPQYVCEISIPGFENGHEIKEYDRSGLEAPVSCCLCARRLLQTSGLLEPSRFPAIYPFVPIPQAVQPQQQKKAKSNGFRTHPRRTPPFWSLSTETREGLWYPTIVFIDSSPREFGLLAILTQHPLPAIPNFPLFIPGNSMNVRLRKCQPGLFSPQELEELRRATLRIMRIVGNRSFVCHLDQFPYLLFPLEPDAAIVSSLREPYWAHDGHPRLGSPSISGVVMSLAAAAAFLPVTTNGTDEIIKDLDAVIQDRRIEYTKHYFVDEIHKDVTPLHKPQEGEVMVL